METGMEQQNKNDKGLDLKATESADARASLEGGCGEEILLVDDDPVVLETYRRILERLNYKVVTASDGREAVDLYGSRFQQISLVVIDFMLPKLEGREVIKEIRAINSEARIIIVTGHFSYYKLNYPEVNEARGQQETVLLKPFSITELSRAIRDKLAE